MVQANIANQGYYNFDPSIPGTLGAAASLSNVDKEILGNILLTYFGSVNTEVKFKSFDFSVMAGFSGGNSIYNVTRRELLNQDFYNNGTEILGSWQSASNQREGWTPRSYGSRGNFINLNGQASSRFVKKQIL